MAFQGKEFTPEMKQLIVNLKLHFDEEKKTGKTVSTRNAIGRVAHGLGVGEATVKRIMADHKQGKSLVVEEKERGKPPCRLSINSGFLSSSIPLLMVFRSHLGCLICAIFNRFFSY
jgi:hypothetical protein